MNFFTRSEQKMLFLAFYHHEVRKCLEKYTSFDNIYVWFQLNRSSQKLISIRLVSMLGLKNIEVASSWYEHWNLNYLNAYPFLAQIV